MSLIPGGARDGRRLSTNKAPPPSTNQEAIRRPFRVGRDLTGNLPWLQVVARGVKKDDARAVAA